jgi:hypothetical protein
VYVFEYNNNICSEEPSIVVVVVVVVADVFYAFARVCCSRDQSASAARFSAPLQQLVVFPNTLISSFT